MPFFPPPLPKRNLLSPPRPLRGSLGGGLPPDPRHTHVAADNGEGNGNRADAAGHRQCDRQARRIAGTAGDARARRIAGTAGDAGDAGQSPISTPHDARDERLAGVWGAPSPQAPPEARWTVGPRVGPRGQSPWAGGREERRAGSHEWREKKD